MGGPVVPYITRSPQRRSSSVILFLVFLVDSDAIASVLPRESPVEQLGRRAAPSSTLR